MEEQLLELAREAEDLDWWLRACIDGLCDAFPEEGPAIAARCGLLPEPLPPPSPLPAWDEAEVRRDIEGWLSQPLERGQGWVKRADGKWLDYAEQHCLRSQLDLPATLALLDRAAPSTTLLYLHEHAARLHADHGEVEAMRAHVASIAHFTTTPSLEFELAGRLPPSLREAERARLLDSFDTGWPLRETQRTGSLLISFAWSPYVEEAIAAVARIPDPMLRLECWGLIIFIVKAHGYVANCILRDCDELLASAPEKLRLDTRDAQTAICTLDRTRLQTVWECWLAQRRGDRVLPWQVVARLAGPAAIETHIQAIQKERR